MSYEFFSRFTQSLSDLISRGSAVPSYDDREFNALALELFSLQFQSVLPFRRLCEIRQCTPETVTDWRQIPCVPASAFKEQELTSLPADQRTHWFHSSGTTGQQPSRHFHNTDSLAVYEKSLLPWFKRHLLADWDELAAEQPVGWDKPGIVALTPNAKRAPNSSLVHMFDAVQREFGSRDSLFVGEVDEAGAWTLNMDQLLFAIRKSMCANRPILLLGTAFSFVHLLDHFESNNIRYRLAEGSRVMETGGYKGRSREMPKQELHRLIKRYLGIPDSHIICEYGMSELSSQAYDRAIQFCEDDPPPAPSPRVFHFPPWARVQIVSPETGTEVPDGERGLIRIFDLANVCSVMAIQTEDIGIRRGTGFELLGRAATAEARGCSLMPAH